MKYSTQFDSTVHLCGFGLHTGQWSEVSFRRCEGVSTLGQGQDRAPVNQLDLVGQKRATSVRLPSGRYVKTVEHLLAAVVGLGAFDGVEIDIKGSEVPIIDGCATAFCDAILKCTMRPKMRREVRILSSARFSYQDAMYVLTPSESTCVRVHIEYPAERFGFAFMGDASWHGDSEMFRSNVAWARTFGAARELEALRSQGLAAHVPVGSVVALDLDEEIFRPREPNEPVVHKLLDLIGDLAILGASLKGNLIAHRPSHEATHAIFAEALYKNVFSKIYTT